MPDARFDAQSLSAWRIDSASLEVAPVLAVDDPALPSWYAENGFAVVGGVHTRAETDEIRDNVSRYQRLIAPSIPRRDWVEYSPSGSVAKMYFMEQVDPYFAALGKRPSLQGLVDRATGRQARYMGAETFNKPAGDGPAALAHQDGAYWVDTDVRIAHVWLPLDAATRDNGAMLYWPGSHLSGSLSHEAIPDGRDLLRVTKSVEDALGPPMIACLGAGDAIVHHGDIVHGSQPNKSTLSRLAMAIAYDVQ